MYEEHRALDAHTLSLRSGASKGGPRTAGLAVGLIVCGIVAIGFDGPIGTMLASPRARDTGGLVVIGLAGIGIVSAGVGLLAPNAPLRRALFAYSALATLYLFSLMLATMVLAASWPSGWIATAAALHGVALAAIAMDWVNRHGIEGSGADLRTVDASQAQIEGRRELEATEYQGYRIRFRRSGEWTVQVFRPSGALWMRNVPMATSKEGRDVLLERVRAAIDEDLGQSRV
ncbi:MAG: hypothetical protein U1E60_04895 [Reyranellaceae bacterium]